MSSDDDDDALPPAKPDHSQPVAKTASGIGLGRVQPASAAKSSANSNVRRLLSGGDDFDVSDDEGSRPLPAATIRGRGEGFGRASAGAEDDFGFSDAGSDAGILSDGDETAPVSLRQEGKVGRFEPNGGAGRAQTSGFSRNNTIGDDPEFGNDDDEPAAPTNVSAKPGPQAPKSAVASATKPGSAVPSQPANRHIFDDASDDSLGLDSHEVEPLDFGDEPAAPAKVAAKPAPKVATSKSADDDALGLDSSSQQDDASFNFGDDNSSLGQADDLGDLDGDLDF